MSVIGDVVGDRRRLRLEAGNDETEVEAPVEAGIAAGTPRAPARGGCPGVDQRSIVLNQSFQRLVSG